MKKVVSRNELKTKMKEAINLLCNTVKVTLGPIGNNVIIDHSLFNPFITNDGVTIAKNIESEDEVINTILELAKEACIKTDESVGDGTTTTLVLLQSIFNNSLKFLENYSPILLKQELDLLTNKIIKDIKKLSIKPTKKDLYNIAVISSNDKIIGKNISDVYLKTKNKDVISIKESDNLYTSINYLKGYSFSTLLASNYYLKNNKKINIDNPYILIIDNNLYDIELVADIINEELKNKNKLIIIANNYSEEFINEILSLNIDYGDFIYLLNTPLYGINSKYTLEDLSLISGAKISSKEIYLNDLGKVNNVSIDEEMTIFNFSNNDKVRLRIKELKNEIKYINDSLEKEFFSRRISMLSTCTAEILIGAPTSLERRELKMRYIDALSAIDTSINGIVPGSGLIFLKISDDLKENNLASKILKASLISPIKQILYNSGVDSNILEEIRNSNYSYIYNIKTKEFENINNTTVIDPTNVIINALQNANSIAGMLLTTSSLIINEYNNTLNKVDDFNEL
ncbi:MAG: hypothetical protein IJD92_01470 [Bacilli bacterium]|nr:hypothetical protein [Bacilli bacterium]